MTIRISAPLPDDSSQILQLGLRPPRSKGILLHHRRRRYHAACGNVERLDLWRVSGGIRPFGAGNFAGALQLRVAPDQVRDGVTAGSRMMGSFKNGCAGIVRLAQRKLPTRRKGKHRQPLD